MDADDAIFYIADPMCSWCWGFSGGAERVEVLCADRPLPFRLVMGGLRNGSADPWTPELRRYLRDTWNRVAGRTGAHFNHALLDLPAFAYDTEPACRAVLTASALLQDAPARQRRILAFFHRVQGAFYLKGADPKALATYEGICDALGLDWASFRKTFASDAMRDATQTEFATARSLAPGALPSLVYRKQRRGTEIARGYADFDKVK
ncbi:MAG: hypothetical protein QNJ13_11015, partial [Paracoccaceae bacterium]|nr:hypothetical protein [Paracoccaceae bacterium]